MLAQRLPLEVALEPVYVMRAAGEMLVAPSVAELAELIECACEAGDELELLHAYFSQDPLPTSEELVRPP